MTHLESATPDPTPDPTPGAPSVPELLQSAVARHQAGELEPAEELYRQVLAIDPDNADALHLLGVIAYQVRNYSAALELIAAAIRRNDQAPAFHNNFGNVLRDQGFWDQALVAYASAVTLDPSFAEANTNLGLVLHYKGKIEDALIRHDKALAIRPGYAEAHFNRGRALRDLEREDEAAAAVEEAIACRPDFAAAHNNLGNLHQQAGRRDQAEQCYLRAVTIDPDDADALNNLGSLLMTDGRLGEAVVRFERALSLRPDFADAWSNLGATSQKQGCVDEAIRAFRQAIELAPDSAEAHWNLALALLLQGDFEAGWPEYEWRSRRKAASPPREIAVPRWSGQALDGHSILLHAEQGLGDTLQFVRYAALVARRGGRVVLECQPELTALLASVPGVAEVRAGGEPLPPVAAHAPLMSLPLGFATRAETIPAEVPYITVPEAAARRWAARLGESEQTSVGLVWAGNPDHANDANRSIDPARLRPLLSSGAQRFVSLQVGARAAQLARLDAGRILDLSAELTDFVETAAAICALDLVITVDTSVAHLAGALGRPVWLLLPFAPDFRWLLEREDSPWYPTMKLFRQPRLGDWDSVVARVAEALSAGPLGSRPRSS